MTPTVVFDFDGVIHSYTSGWKGKTVIPDPPVQGIREAINDIRKLYRVVVVSTRCDTPDGIMAVKEYLAKHDIVVDDVMKENRLRLCMLTTELFVLMEIRTDYLIKSRNLNHGRQKR